VETSPLLLAMLAAATVVVAVSGVVLTRSGSPFSSVVLNAHKLVDLALLVTVGVIVFRDARVAPLSRVGLVSTALVAGFQLVTLVSGGVVSALQSAPRGLTWLHRLVSWFALAMTLWWGVLFLA
jgi:hypothetical protein